MHMLDQLLHATVRIEARTGSGVSTGSGFVCVLCERDGSRVPVLVSNRHVFENAESARLYISVMDDHVTDPNPQERTTIWIDVPDIQNFIFYHPDANIDLAVMAAQPIYNRVREFGKIAFIMEFSKNVFLNDHEAHDTLPAADILMVGYPNGLWDQVNNSPIIRRGIMATPIYQDFCGRPEFVIDCACFPGSSGSPVLVYHHGFRFARNQENIAVGVMQIRLAGVLYGGPQHTADGKIVVETIPTRSVPLSRTRIPNNLGYCIKIDQIYEIENLIARHELMQ